jgi:ABC-2 type transport system ATP-binding protein
MDGDASGSMDDNIIRIEHLSKEFKSKVRTVLAVDDISFEVRRGEIFGLLGPNGAGKSTLIRIMTTLLRPTSGTAYLDTYEVSKNPEKIRSIIGVCPQNSTLDLELTAYENLEFYGKLVNVDDRVLHGRILDLLAMAGLSHRAHLRVQTYSGGMRRKLEIVRAFIHYPLILFLDEPTIGLDPESRREVWHQISTLNAEKTTIILTTHYMDEAEKLCHRIAFVDRGRLITLDTMENLKLAFPAGDLIEIGAGSIPERFLEKIRSIPQIISAEARERQIHVSARNGGAVLPEILSVFEREGVRMESISIRSPSLEDVFLYLTGKHLSDGKPDAILHAGGRKP